MDLERNFEICRLKLGKLYGKLSFFPESLSSTKSSSKKNKNGDLKKNILKLQEYMKNYNELKKKENEIINKKNEEVRHHPYNHHSECPNVVWTDWHLAYLYGLFRHTTDCKS